MSEFTVGKIYYSAQGSRVELQAITTDGLFIVSETYKLDTYDGGGFVQGPLIFERTLYKSAPVAVIDEQIIALREEKERLEELNQAKRAEALDAERDVRGRLDKLRKYKGLEHLEAFLDGKMTHVVYNNYYGYQVEPLSKFEEKDDYRHNSLGLKLVTLFGKSNGDLSWHVNDYRDGSGSWTEIYPCASQKDAEAKRLSLIAENVETGLAVFTADRPYYLVQAVEWAIKYSVAIPEQAAEIYQRETEKANQQNRVVLEKEIAERQAKIKALEPSA